MMTTVPTDLELRQARAAAVDANLEAEAQERKARAARRRATAKQKHYEDLVLIHQGQLTIDDA